MKFKIKCKSIKEFSPDQGSYVKCDCEIEVESSQVGTLVRCPQCGNGVEVINPNMMGAPDPLLGSSDEDLLDPKSSQQTSGVDSPAIDILHDPIESPKSSKGISVEEQPQEVDLLEEEIIGQNDLTSTGTPPPTSFDVPQTNSNEPNDSPTQTSAILEPTSTLAFADYGRENSCHKCGTLLEEKQPVCPNCKTQRRAAFVDKAHRKPFSTRGPFGFQLWLKSMTTSRTPGNDSNLFSVVSYIMSVLMMGSGIAFIIFAGIIGVFVGLLTTGLGYCLFVGLRFWGKSSKDPRTPIPAVGQVIWVILLFGIRQFRFNTISQSAKLIRKFDEDFGDRELKAINDLNKYHVIDLEGTKITDESLLFLYNLRGIEYLVLRNTEVTTDAVHDLQQTVPKTWIWY